MPCRAVPYCATVPCRPLPMSWGAVSLVDHSCITIRDYVLHCAGLHKRYTRVTVGSQVLAQIEAYGKFYALSLRLGSLSTEAALRSHHLMQVLCSQLQEPCSGLCSGMPNMVRSTVYSDTHLKTLHALRPELQEPYTGLYSGMHNMVVLSIVTHISTD